MHSDQGSFHKMKSIYIYLGIHSTSFPYAAWPWKRYKFAHIRSVLILHAVAFYEKVIGKGELNTRIEYYPVFESAHNILILIALACIEGSCDIAQSRPSLR